MVRLQKFLAESGVASRRASEQYILDGRVSVNGHIVRELGTKVDPDADRVQVDGKPIRPQKKLYIAFNKPRGCLCTRSDETGDRPLLSNFLPPHYKHLQTVGRLDYDSEGLILLTNDGEFSVRVSHPRYGIRKIYNVLIAGTLDEAAQRQILKGVFSEGEVLKATRIKLLGARSGQSLIEMELAEGKNREIRRIFGALGISIKRLQRVRIGKIRLGDLAIGKWRTLTSAEIKSLLGPL